MRGTLCSTKISDQHTRPKELCWPSASCPTWSCVGLQRVDDGLSLCAVDKCCRPRLCPDPYQALLYLCQASKTFFWMSF